MAAYRNASVAFAHAATILGVEVTACELREVLPEIVRDDLAVEAEFESDDDTPQVVEFDVSDVDDAPEISGDLDLGGDAVKKKPPP